MAINIIEAAKVAKARTSDKRWQNAIDKAVAGVTSGQWIVTELAHCVAVTTESEKTYRANDKHCQCPAFFQGQACKHRALYRLLQIAETETARPAVSRADIIADIKAAWSRRFPTESLADELMRRFRRNQLEMLSVDFLTAIRAAIA
jgi:hypothetical protein